MLCCYFRYIAGLSFILFVHSSKAQIITSVNDGFYHSPTTWAGGVVPNAMNSDSIIINHQVVIAANTEVHLDQASVNGVLRVEHNATLYVVYAEGQVGLRVSGRLDVYGKLIHSNMATIAGTSVGNTTFYNGSLYHFQWQSAGDLAVVQWEADATLLVDGFIGNVSITLASWIQVFGNVIYDCPLQGDFMDFNGRVTNIQGDLIIRNTNNKMLTMARTHAIQLTIGGSLVVEGPSRITLTESSPLANVIISKDFQFLSSASGISYLTRSGIVTIQVGGNVTIDALGKLKSTIQSGGVCSLKVKGDFNFLKGTLDALGDGKGIIEFNGTSTQHYLRSSSAYLEGNLDFIVAAGAEVDLGTSQLSNTLSGKFEVNGKVNFGSTHEQGPLQSVAGNVFVKGSIDFMPGSTIEYNGLSPQYMLAHPQSDQVTTIINNATQVILQQDQVFGDVIVSKGSFPNSAYTLTVAKNLTVAPNASLALLGNLVCNGSSTQLLDCNGSTIKNIDIGGSNTAVHLQSELHLTGLLSFSSADATVHTNGNLVVESTSINGASNGRIGPLAGSNAINGDVLIKRYMDTGSLYRYLSSPVTNATVASWQDDFPVTGTFEDPSTGPGINSGSPSLFYYDESDLSGWIPYPQAGKANENALLPGRGYAAFIRDQHSPVTWDVMGSINHGDIDLNVQYTPGQDDLDGWNLVGNPYPCSISWSKAGWIKNGMSAGIAVRDNVSGRFRVWDGSIGDLDNGNIALGQAFWVRSIADSPQLTLTEQAKETGDVSFFRAPAEPVDYIELKLSTPSAYDVAYFRLRKDAGAGLDEFDIPQLVNEELTLSLLTAEGNKLSLFATDRIGCMYEIPLNVATRSTDTAITLQRSAFGIFEHSLCILINTKTEEEIVMGDKAIDVNPAYLHSYKLRIESSASLKTNVTMPEIICRESQVVVKVNESDHAQHYSLRRISDHQEFVYDGSATGFIIPPTANRYGDYLLKLKSACAMDSILISLVEALPAAPRAVDQMACAGTTAVLIADGAKPNQEYAWYNGKGNLIIGSGDYYYQAENQDETYFVSVVDTLTGCESKKTTMATTAVQLKVDIVFENNVLKMSDQAVVNQWFYDNILVAENSGSLNFQGPGNYVVRMWNGFCWSEGQFVYHGDPLSPFPNPSHDFIYFNQTHGPVIINDVIDIKGGSVFYLCDLECSDFRCRLDVQQLSRGVYIIIFNHKGVVAKRKISLY